MTEHPLDRYPTVFGVARSGEHLGTLGNLDSITSLASSLSRRDVLYAASRLMWDMEFHTSQDLRQAQLQFVAQLPEHMKSDIAQKLRTGSQAGGYDILFYPQQLLIMQRLALRFGQEGPARQFNSGAEIDSFLRLAAHVVDVIHSSPSGSVLEDSHSNKLLSTGIYLARNAVANRTTFFKAAAGRAFRLWHGSTCEWPKDLQTLEEYSQEQFQTSLREFTAIACAHPLTAGITADVILSPPHVFSKTSVSADTVNRVFEFLTLNSRDLPEISSSAFFWDFLSQLEKPYLPYAERTLVTSSFGRAFEVATASLFWLLDGKLHRQGRSDQMKSLRALYGYMFQDYCFRLLRSIESARTRVFPEIPYTAGKRNVRRSSDIMIADVGSRASYAIFVECTSEC